MIVAAAGNDGARELTWPAASRLAVAVGASRVEASYFSDVESYSNRSPALDILAPGGALSVDLDGDGVSNGIIAQTIDPADPTQIGYWMYEGTSQAAAIASGAAAWLLAAGVDPRDVGATLQQSSGGYSSLDAQLAGTAADALDIGGALAEPASSREVHVGLLPFVTPGWFGPRPAARVVALDERGAPLADASVLATVYSASQVYWTRCDTDADGVCTLKGASTSASDAWAFRVDAVEIDGVGHHPSRALFATDGGVALLEAFEAARTERAALGVYWPGGVDPVVGETLESWAVVDVGVGLLSSPLGIVFLPGHIGGLATEELRTIEVDGVGLLSSPLGIDTRILRFDGTDLLYSPLGASLTLIGVDGVGLLSSPLGFHVSHLYALGGTGLLSSPLGLWSGEPIAMDQGRLLAGVGRDDADEIEGYEALLDDSTRTERGYEAGAWLIGSGVVDVGVEIAPSAAAPASAAKAVRLKP